MASLTEIIPIFPVRDMGISVEHYRKLGFDVEQYDGGESYAYCRRGSIEIHLAEVTRPALKPKKNMSAAYLRVDDADALFAEWSQSGAGGHDTEPTDTSYGLREGAHHDDDANLIRYGSPLNS